MFVYILLHNLRYHSIMITVYMGYINKIFICIRTIFVIIVLLKQLPWTMAIQININIWKILML